jgi:hypothetical protein
MAALAVACSASSSSSSSNGGVSPDSGADADALPDDAASRVDGSPNDGSAPAALACKAYDVCNILSAYDVKGALGGDVMPGKPSSPSTDGQHWYISGCNWETNAIPGAPRAPSGSLTIRCDDRGDPNTPASMKLLWAGVSQNVTDVGGIRDAAVWESVGGGATLIDGQLDVFVGANADILAHVGGMPDDATALDGAKALVQKFLSRL